MLSYWIMNMRYTKMAAAGNSFAIIEWPESLELPDSNTVCNWSNAAIGIGFDQLMIIREASKISADAKYYIFNADGSKAEQCGNGARCVAKYLSKKKDKKNIKLESVSGDVEALVLKDSNVTISLGIPDFNPKSLPFFYNDKKDIYITNFKEISLKYSVLSVGNPHIVVLNDGLGDKNLEDISYFFQNEKNLFPEGVNVGFMKIINKELITLRVFERGVGETLACGTGAVAAVAVGIKYYDLNEKVKVTMLGGELAVSWPSLLDQLWLTGKTNYCNDGEINYEG